MSRLDRAMGAAAGVLVDRTLGEPPITPHPLRVYGMVMRNVERVLWADRKAPGVAHAAVGAGIGLAAGAALRSTAGATYLAVGGKSLQDEARRVGKFLAADDLDGARAALPALVGRNPERLTAREISRAVVESVAENTVDAIVAPALWAAVFGAPGALGLRAVNTIDAMVGNRTLQYLNYGWASARLDDVAEWVPARVTAFLVAAVRPRSALQVMRTVKRDAAAHPSPNAGVAEAAFAAALGLQLGGVNLYGDKFEERPPLGDGRRPEPGDIERVVDLCDDVSLALVGFLAAPALLQMAIRQRRATQLKSLKGLKPPKLPKLSKPKAPKPKPKRLEA